MLRIWITNITDRHLLTIVEDDAAKDSVVGRLAQAEMIRRQTKVPAAA